MTDRSASQRHPLTLGRLLQVLPDARMAASVDAARIEVLSITADSRNVAPGALYVAVDGDRFDGHRFIPQALDAGAVVVLGTASPADLLRRFAVPKDAPYVQVLDSRKALARASAALFDFPSRKLAVIGVTGTDGKTTSSIIVESILAAATATSEHPEGEVGVITTVGARVRGQDSDTGYHVTTPDAPEVQRLLTEMVESGCRYGVIEATSHGLTQARVAAVDFDVAAVTNITHEHLDYHGTRDAYVAAKALLFRALFAGRPKQGIPRCAVLNADDSGSFGALLAILNEEALHHARAVPIRSYGIADADGIRQLDVAAHNIRYAPDCTRFLLYWWAGAFEVESRLIGEFNVYNLLCAATVTLALGVAPEHVRAGIARMGGVLGRMQRMDAGQPFHAIVDFAHTPVSLERALRTLRPLAAREPVEMPGRLIAIFGSAGLRDREKRFRMGRVSGELADFTVITAEDPRTEDVNAICAEIAAGVSLVTDQSHFVILPDRAEAIQYAVDMARPGDVVAAFGKGHERSMCYGEIEYPWSDQDTMLAALARRMRAPAP